MKRILVVLILVFLMSSSFDQAAAGEPVLSPPPLMPNQPDDSPLSDSADGASVVMDYPFTVFLPLVSRPLDKDQLNTRLKSNVETYYETYYLNQSTSIGWMGNLDACDYGSTNEDFRKSVLGRINYFRVMAGVPPLTALNETFNVKAQAAAALMSINDALDHTPPTSWRCYSQLAYNGASSSNLALGAYGLGAINLYMLDPGDGNGAVGHRRWILYPQTQEMGTGDIASHDGYWSSNALVVFDSHMWEARPETRDEFVAWPPPGYVPYPVVYPRWSFSYPKADFSSAFVSMTKNGQSVSQINMETVVNIHKVWH